MTHKTGYTGNEKQGLSLISEAQMEVLKKAMHRILARVEKALREIWDFFLKATARYIGKPRWYYLYKNAKKKRVRRKYSRILSEQFLMLAFAEQ